MHVYVAWLLNEWALCSCFFAQEPHVRAVCVCECVCTCLLETDHRPLQLTTRETAHCWYFSNSAQATFVPSFLLCDERNDSVESSSLSLSEFDSGGPPDPSAWKCPPTVPGLQASVPASGAPALLQGVRQIRML